MIEDATERDLEWARGHLTQVPWDRSSFEDRAKSLARSFAAAREEGRVECQALAFSWMRKHDALLGWIQQRPTILKELIESDPRAAIITEVSNAGDAGV